MTQFFRLVGWLLLIAGLAVASLALQAKNGVAPLGIDVFGGSIRTPEQATRWIGMSLFAAVTGLLILFFTRRNWTKVNHR
jgi:hypothetical protein